MNNDHESRQLQIFTGNSHWSFKAQTWYSVQLVLRGLNICKTLTTAMLHPHPICESRPMYHWNFWIYAQQAIVHHDPAAENVCSCWSKTPKTTLLISRRSRRFVTFVFSLQLILLQLQQQDDTLFICLCEFAAPGLLQFTNDVFLSFYRWRQLERRRGSVQRRLWTRPGAGWETGWALAPYLNSSLQAFKHF